jgi:hypothetical protein
LHQLASPNSSEFTSAKAIELFGAPFAISAVERNLAGDEID